MGDDLQILGICRFSYPAIGGFKVSHPTLQAKRDFLYDPARLDQRFAWFSEVTLPALRAQTDPSFSILLLTGPDFPQMNRLLALIADIPQIKLVTEEPQPHREICTTVLQRHIRPGVSCTAQFRLDDDDAVAVNFVARLRRDYPTLVRPLMQGAGKPIVLDHSFGITLNRTKTGPLALYPQISHQHPAGLVLFAPPNFQHSVMSFAHHKLNHRFPMLSLADQVMFLRGRHDGNDSGDAVRVGTPVDLPGPARRILRERFALDLARLERELPRPAE